MIGIFTALIKKKYKFIKFAIFLWFFFISSEVEIFNFSLNSKNLRYFPNRRPEKKLIISLRKNREKRQIKACTKPGQAIKPNIFVEHNLHPRREWIFVLTFAVVNEFEEFFFVDFI